MNLCLLVYLILIATIPAYHQLSILFSYIRRYIYIYSLSKMWLPALKYFGRVFVYFHENAICRFNCWRINVIILKAYKTMRMKIFEVIILVISLWQLLHIKKIIRERLARKIQTSFKVNQWH